MSVHETEIREAVVGFVEALPSDLLSEMVELEASGQLADALEAAFCHVKLKHDVSLLFQKYIRSEVTPLLWALVSSVTTADKATRSTLTAKATSDVFRQPLRPEPAFAGACD